MSTFVLESIRILLAGIFLVSGAGKLVSADGLANLIEQFVGFGAQTSNVISIAVALVEVACGGMLLFKVNTNAVSLLLLGLTGLFTVGQVLILQTSQEIDCGCFGSLLPENIGLTTIARNILIMICAWLISTRDVDSKGTRF